MNQGESRICVSKVKRPACIRFSSQFKWMLFASVPETGSPNLLFFLDDVLCYSLEKTNRRRKKSNNQRKKKRNENKENEKSVKREKLSSSYAKRKVKGKQEKLFFGGDDYHHLLRYL